ncbi:MAG: lasso peptide biosynthesis B2 protein [Hyphomicrobiaceae bacterium]
MVWPATRILIDGLHERPLARAVLLACALVLVPLVWIALRLRGGAGLGAALVSSGNRPADAPALRDLQRLGAIVNRAARMTLLPATCLARALVLRWMLARVGVDARLVIGAKPAGDRLAAHAWIEVDGKPINERGDVGREFAPLAYASRIAPF